MLALLFSCCGLRHRSHDQPDDRTPLIPRADDIPTQAPPLLLRAPPLTFHSSPQPRVIDQQNIKERLGSVIRSKEGKMVNVNAQFPFNLHNHDHPDHSSSGSSRNVSGGTLSSSRAPSPSPPRHLHKSRSNASVRPDPDDPAHYLAVNASAPVLNVRLVKSARSHSIARGRSQRCGNLNNRTQSELPPDEEHTPRALPPSSASEHLPVNSETPPHHPEDFNILDAGAVARSWGD